MAKEKPTAVATINFYPNKHVEVRLSSIAGITPRTLEIAGNILSKEYRGMKAQFIARSHRDARKEKEIAERVAVENEKAFHKKEDIRLAKAAGWSADKIKALFSKKEETVEA